jgi:frataxin-like iron-binding protein CyaY
MEQSEFHELTEATVARFLDRIPARYVDGFEAELDGGEYTMAVENLVLTLVNDKVPVTQSEQEDLRQLLDYLNQPTSKLDDLTMSAG